MTTAETRIRENKEGRIQESGSVMIIAHPGETPEDTLLYLPQYKSNPRKNIKEGDFGLLSETMRLAESGRREAPLQAARRGYLEEMDDDLTSKKLLIQPGRVYSRMLFDTSKGWDTNVSHVQGYLTVFWVNDTSQFPLAADTEEMMGAEWVSVKRILDPNLKDLFRFSPPSPIPVVDKLLAEGFLKARPESLTPIDWNKQIPLIDPSGSK